ncbi:MAG: YitT family protein [Clostridia bacterium]|nr:YitT family protein [Clostridia bacterium]
MQEQHNTLPPKITRADIENEQTKKGKVFYWAKVAVVLLLSAFLVAFASYSLIAPNDFTIGGIAGIAILLNVASSGAIPQSIVLFAINFPLVVLSFFFVKKKFAILTAISIFLQSAWLFVIENLFPNFVIRFDLPAERIFASIAAGLCIGSALALSFNIGGSTGGADIIAVIIQKKVKSSSIAWILFGINCIIIGSSLFVFYDPEVALAYNLLPIMISAFESFVESKTQEAIANGFHSAIEFRVITDKPEEMANALMKELSRGVTMLPATGMYTKEPHPMIMCVVNRRQVPTLKTIIKTIDPDSFAVMSTVSQVLGLGFYSGEFQ